MFVQSFMKLFAPLLKLKRGHDVDSKNFKGHNSVKDESCVTVLFLGIWGFIFLQSFTKIFCTVSKI